MNFEDAAQATVRLVRSRLRALAIAFVVGAVIGYALSLLIPRRYLASTVFTVASERNSMSINRLAGFAAQLGIAPSLGSSESPDFFASVAQSRDVRAAMAHDTVCESRRCQTVAIAMFDSLPAQENRLGWERLLKRLDQRLSVGVDPKTGIITSTAWGRSPADAEALLRVQMRALSDAVVTRRASQARNERLFAEDRLQYLDRRRRAVADSLIYFYESNRSLGSSPALRLRERQLTDELSQWQELVQNVARQGELARLDEARDVPVITIIAHPFASPKKIFPHGSTFAAAGAFLGVLGVLSLAIVRRREA